MTIETPDAKAALRRMMRERRRALPGAEKAAAERAISARLDVLCADAAVVAVYLATPDEIDLSSFILSRLSGGTTVAAPRWNGIGYDLARVRGLGDDDLRTGPMGVREPAAAELLSPRQIDVWIVPGLAFTAAGKRLGYGGGWYDRMMSGASASARRLGVAHPFQIVGDFPADAHDIPVTDIITPSDPAPARTAPAAGDCRAGNRACHARNSDGRST
jgi:5-formyltetrahydrofolate cyclo-ligase